MFQTGTLIVRPQAGKITIDTETFGKMDPFVKLQIGATTYQTEVAENEHKTPTWTDSFVFRINGEQTLQMSVLEQDSISSNDLIGEGVIQLADIFIKKNFSNWFEVRKDGKATASIMVSFEFYPDGVQLPPGFPTSGRFK